MPFLCLVEFYEKGSLGETSFYLSKCVIMIQLHREKMDFRTYASSKASGEPAHSRSLTRSFAVCLKFYQGVLFIKSKQLNFWRDCSDAQAPLKLCCLHVRRPIFLRRGSYRLCTCVQSSASVFPTGLDNKNITWV